MLQNDMLLDLGYTINLNIIRIFQFISKCEFSKTLQIVYGQRVFKYYIFIYII